MTDGCHTRFEGLKDAIHLTGIGGRICEEGLSSGADILDSIVTIHAGASQSGAGDEVHEEEGVPIAPAVALRGRVSRTAEAVATGALATVTAIGPNSATNARPTAEAGENDEDHPDTHRFSQTLLIIFLVIWVISAKAEEVVN